MKKYLDSSLFEKSFKVELNTPLCLAKKAVTYKYITTLINVFNG